MLRAMDWLIMFLARLGVLTMLLGFFGFSFYLLWKVISNDN